MKINNKTLFKLAGMLVMCITSTSICSAGSTTNTSLLDNFRQMNKTIKAKLHQLVESLEDSKDTKTKVTMTLGDEPRYDSLQKHKEIFATMKGLIDSIPEQALEHSKSLPNGTGYTVSYNDNYLVVQQSQNIFFIRLGIQFGPTLVLQIGSPSSTLSFDPNHSVHSDTPKPVSYEIDCTSYSGLEIFKLRSQS